MPRTHFGSSDAIIPNLCKYKPQVFNVIVSEENSQRQVFFVKTNSVAHLCIDYSTKNSNSRGIYSFPTQIYSDYHTKATTNDVIVTVEPNSIPLGHGLEKTAVYTITTKDKTGVYWLPENQICNSIAILVYTDSVSVNRADIPITSKCDEKLLDAKISGYDGGVMDYRYAKLLR